MDHQTIAANQRQQAELYGRPLGDIVREVTRAFGLSQARLAEALGMSAPMLSLLASGQRVKIGNPQSVTRLRALLELVPHAAGMSPQERAHHVEAIAGITTTMSHTGPNPELARALAAVGNRQALLAAAGAAAPHSQALAALLQTAAEQPGA